MLSSRTMSWVGNPTSLLKDERGERVIGITPTCLRDRSLLSGLWQYLVQQYLVGVE
jgi:hypothetical protein